MKTAYKDVYNACEDCSGEKYSRMKGLGNEESAGLTNAQECWNALTRWNLVGN